jgi:prepilin-type N-terminal cleavage/methylation domain-containing protein
MRSRVRSKRGFTLIELMIVVVILGILAAIAIPKFGEVTKRSKEAEAPPVLRQLHTLQERHREATGGYGTTFAVLEGGASNFANGKYYSFSMLAATSTAYSACGRPLDPTLGLTAWQIDETGDIQDVASC